MKGGTCFWNRTSISLFAVTAVGYYGIIDLMIGKTRCDPATRKFDQVSKKGPKMIGAVHSYKSQSTARGIRERQWLLVLLTVRRIKKQKIAQRCRAVRM